MSQQPPVREASIRLPPDVDGMVRGELQMGVDQLSLDQGSDEGDQPSDESRYQVRVRWWGECKGSSTVLSVNSSAGDGVRFLVCCGPKYLSRYFRDMSTLNMVVERISRAVDGTDVANVLGHVPVSLRSLDIHSPITGTFPVLSAGQDTLGRLDVVLSVSYTPLVSSFELNEHFASVDFSLPIFPTPNAAGQPAGSNAGDSSGFEALQHSASGEEPATVPTLPNPKPASPPAGSRAVQHSPAEALQHGSSGEEPANVPTFATPNAASQPDAGPASLPAGFEGLQRTSSGKELASQGSTQHMQDKDMQTAVVSQPGASLSYERQLEAEGGHAAANRKTAPVAAGDHEPHGNCTASSQPPHAAQQAQQADSTEDAQHVHQPTHAPYQALHQAVTPQHAQQAPRSSPSRASGHPLPAGGPPASPQFRHAVRVFSSPQAQQAQLPQQAQQHFPSVPHHPTIDADHPETPANQPSGSSSVQTHQSASPPRQRAPDGVPSSQQPADSAARSDGAELEERDDTADDVLDIFELVERVLARRQVRLVEVFREADRQGAGLLGFAEIKGMLAKLLPERSAGLHARYVLLMLDGNEDARVSYQEFSEAIREFAEAARCVRTGKDRMVAQTLQPLAIRLSQHLLDVQKAFWEVDITQRGSLSYAQLVKLLRNVAPGVTRRQERFLLAKLSQAVDGGRVTMEALKEVVRWVMDVDAYPPEDFVPKPRRAASRQRPARSFERLKSKGKRPADTSPEPGKPYETLSLASAQQAQQPGSRPQRASPGATPQRSPRPSPRVAKAAASPNVASQPASSPPVVGQGDPRTTPFVASPQRSSSAVADGAPTDAQHTRHGIQHVSQRAQRAQQAEAAKPRATKDLVQRYRAALGQASRPPLAAHNQQQKSPRSQPLLSPGPTPHISRENAAPEQLVGGAPGAQQAARHAQPAQQAQQPGLSCAEQIRQRFGLGQYRRGQPGTAAPAAAAATSLAWSGQRQQIRAAPKPDDAAPGDGAPHTAPTSPSAQHSQQLQQQQHSTAAAQQSIAQPATSQPPLPQLGAGYSEAPEPRGLVVQPLLGWPVPPNAASGVPILANAGFQPGNHPVARQSTADPEQPPAPADQRAEALQLLISRAHRLREELDRSRHASRRGGPQTAAARSHTRSFGFPLLPGYSPSQPVHYPALGFGQRPPSAPATSLSLSGLPSFGPADRQPRLAAGSVHSSLDFGALSLFQPVVGSVIGPLAPDGPSRLIQSLNLDHELPPPDLDSDAYDSDPAALVEDALLGQLFFSSPAKPPGSVTGPSSHDPQHHASPAVQPVERGGEVAGTADPVHAGTPAGAGALTGGDHSHNMQELDQASNVAPQKTGAEAATGSVDVLRHALLPTLAGAAAGPQRETARDLIPVKQELAINLPAGASYPAEDADAVAGIRGVLVVVHSLETTLEDNGRLRLFAKALHPGGSNAELSREPSAASAAAHSAAWQAALPAPASWGSELPDRAQPTLVIEVGEELGALAAPAPASRPASPDASVPAGPAMPAGVGRAEHPGRLLGVVRVPLQLPSKTADADDDACTLAQGQYAIRDVLRGVDRGSLRVHAQLLSGPAGGPEASKQAQPGAQPIAVRHAFDVSLISLNRLPSAQALANAELPVPTSRIVRYRFPGEPDASCSAEFAAMSDVMLGAQTSHSFTLPAGAELAASLGSHGVDATPPSLTFEVRDKSPDCPDTTCASGQLPVSELLNLATQFAAATTSTTTAAGACTPQDSATCLPSSPEGEAAGNGGPVSATFTIRMRLVRPAVPNDPAQGSVSQAGSAAAPAACISSALGPPLGTASPAGKAAEASDGSATGVAGPPAATASTAGEADAADAVLRIKVAYAAEPLFSGLEAEQSSGSVVNGAEPTAGGVDSSSSDIYAISGPPRALPAPIDAVICVEVVRACGLLAAVNEASVWLGGGAGLLGRAKQAGPHSFVQISLFPSDEQLELRVPPIKTPFQAQTFCPDYRFSQEVPLTLDSRAVKALATQELCLEVHHHCPRSQAVAAALSSGQRRGSRAAQRDVFLGSAAVPLTALLNKPQGLRAWLGLKSRRGEAAGAVQIAIYFTQLGGERVPLSGLPRAPLDASADLCALLPADAPPLRLSGAHDFDGQAARASIFVEEATLPQGEDLKLDRPRAATYHATYRLPGTREQEMTAGRPATATPPAAVVGIPRAWKVALQHCGVHWVCANAALVAALQSAPLAVSLFRQEVSRGSSGAGPKPPPIPVGTAEVDLSPLLRARPSHKQPLSRWLSGTFLLIHPASKHLGNARVRVKVLLELRPPGEAPTGGAAHTWVPVDRRAARYVHQPLLAGKAALGSPSKPVQELGMAQHDSMQSGRCSTDAATAAAAAPAAAEPAAEAMDAGASEEHPQPGVSADPSAHPAKPSDLHPAGAGAATADDHGRPNLVASLLAGSVPTTPADPSGLSQVQQSPSAADGQQAQHCQASLGPEPHIATSPVDRAADAAPGLDLAERQTNAEAPGQSTRAAAVTESRRGRSLSPPFRPITISVCVESALHLPTPPPPFAVHDAGSSPDAGVFVSFDWHATRSTICTPVVPIVESATGQGSARWFHSRQLPLDPETLAGFPARPGNSAQVGASSAGSGSEQDGVQMNGSLVHMTVWRRALPTDAEATALQCAEETRVDPALDTLLGSAVVDLGALSALGEIRGWYNIAAADGQPRGQLKVVVAPSEALSRSPTRAPGRQRPAAAAASLQLHQLATSAREGAQHSAAGAAGSADQRLELAEPAAGVEESLDAESEGGAELMAMLNANLKELDEMALRMQQRLYPTPVASHDPPLDSPRQAASPPSGELPGSPPDKSMLQPVSGLPQSQLPGSPSDEAMLTLLSGSREAPGRRPAQAVTTPNPARHRNRGAESASQPGGVGSPPPVQKPESAIQSASGASPPRGRIVTASDFVLGEAASPDDAAPAVEPPRQVAQPQDATSAPRLDAASAGSISRGRAGAAPAPLNTAAADRAGAAPLLNSEPVQPQHGQPQHEQRQHEQPQHEQRQHDQAQHEQQAPSQRQAAEAARQHPEVDAAQLRLARVTTCSDDEDYFVMGDLGGYDSSGSGSSDAMLAGLAVERVSLGGLQLQPRPADGDQPLPMAFGPASERFDEDWIFNMDRSTSASQGPSHADGAPDPRAGQGAAPGGAEHQPGRRSSIISVAEMVHLSRHQSDSDWERPPDQTASAQWAAAAPAQEPAPGSSGGTVGPPRPARRISFTNSLPPARAAGAGAADPLRQPAGGVHEQERAIGEPPPRRSPFSNSLPPPRSDQDDPCVREPQTHRSSLADTPLPGRSAQTDPAVLAPGNAERAAEGSASAPAVEAPQVDPAPAPATPATPRTAADAQAQPPAQQFSLTKRQTPGDQTHPAGPADHPAEPAAGQVSDDTATLPAQQAAHGTSANLQSTPTGRSQAGHPQPVPNPFREAEPTGPVSTAEGPRRFSADDPRASDSALVVARSNSEEVRSSWQALDRSTSLIRRSIGSSTSFRKSLQPLQDGDESETPKAATAGPAEAAGSAKPGDPEVACEAPAIATAGASTRSGEIGSGSSGALPFLAGPYLSVQPRTGMRDFGTEEAPSGALQLLLGAPRAEMHLAVATSVAPHVNSPPVRSPDGSPSRADDPLGLGDEWVFGFRKRRQGWLQRNLHWDSDDEERAIHKVHGPSRASARSRPHPGQPPPHPTSPSKPPSGLSQPSHTSAANAAGGQLRQPMGAPGMRREGGSPDKPGRKSPPLVRVPPIATVPSLGTSPSHGGLAVSIAQQYAEQEAQESAQRAQQGSQPAGQQGAQRAGQQGQEVQPANHTPSLPQQHKPPVALADDSQQLAVPSAERDALDKQGADAAKQHSVQHAQASTQRAQRDTQQAQQIAQNAQQEAQQALQVAQQALQLVQQAQQAQQQQQEARQQAQQPHGEPEHMPQQAQRAQQSPPMGLPAGFQQASGHYRWQARALPDQATAALPARMHSTHSVLPVAAAATPPAFTQHAFLPQSGPPADAPASGSTRSAPQLQVQAMARTTGTLPLHAVAPVPAAARGDRPPASRARPATAEPRPPTPSRAMSFIDSTLAAINGSAAQAATAAGAPPQPDTGPLPRASSCTAMGPAQANSADVGTAGGRSLSPQDLTRQMPQQASAPVAALASQQWAHGLSSAYRWPERLSGFRSSFAPQYSAFRSRYGDSSSRPLTPPGGSITQHPAPAAVNGSHITTGSTAGTATPPPPPQLAPTGSAAAGTAANLGQEAGARAPARRRFADPEVERIARIMASPQ